LLHEDYPVMRAFSLVLLSLLCFKIQAENVYSHKVLGLYNSAHGQTEKENEIYFYLLNPLREMGLEVRFHDINSGIPQDLSDVRAVISWFRGGAVKNPEEYLRFIARVIRSGRKFIILGNLGAFQDSDSGEYISKEKINSALSLLGIKYEYQWTDNADFLEIVKLVSPMCEYEGRQDVSVSGFYYRFLRADRNLRIYLSVRRKDRDYEPSPVIVSNRNGGFALGGYTYRVKEGKIVMLLNVKEFLSVSLFPDAEYERIAILADTGTAPGKEVLKNTKTVLRWAKLPFEVITRENLNKMLPQDLFAFTAVGLIIEDDAGLNPAFFMPFLKRGGGIVSLIGGNFSNLSQLLALSDEKNEKTTIREYRFREGFFLGEELSITQNDYLWEAGASVPGRDADVIAYSYDGNTALLWTAERESGRILAWNWKAFRHRSFQGFILESFLFIRPVGIAGVAGVGTIYIDDWPLPMYNVIKKPLSVTDTEFYTGVWWPEIKAFFLEYGIPFTSLLIFEYNAVNSWPLVVEEFFVGKDRVSVLIAREIAESGNELGLHGYNHLSLVIYNDSTGYGFWPDRESLKEALLTAKEEWIRLFGESTLPVSYVPPNNIISRDGIEILHKVFPSIEVIGSLFTGRGTETVTGFGSDPSIPDIYYLPRISAGYLFKAGIRDSIVSAISGYGIWTHFIHPDDVFDTGRSGGKSWKELKRELGRTVEFVKHNYPWLNFMPSRKAVSVLREYERAQPEFFWDEEKKVLRVSSPPGFRFRIRIDNTIRIKSIEGAEIIYRYREIGAAVLKSTEGVCRLTFD